MVNQLPGFDTSLAYLATDEEQYFGANSSLFSMQAKIINDSVREAFKIHGALGGSGTNKNCRNPNQQKAESEKQKKEYVDERDNSSTDRIVAALIANVTFAASFTLSGGYNSSSRLDQGLAVLTRIAAFEVFVSLIL